MNTIFLFPHQDDEFGVFHEIQKHAQSTCCFYFTCGKEKDDRRNKESIRVLTQLGVSSQNIYFPGHDLNIIDLQLIDRIEDVITWLCAYLSQNKHITKIYVPAWEGGHPDHDALNAATIIAKKITGHSSQIFQFPLYNGYQCPKPFFRIFHPLKDNGDVLLDRIPVKKRLKYLLHCLSYPSQWTTWVGLFPFVLFSYIVYGKQQLQEISTKEEIAKPHNGLLYYEARNFSTWQKIKENLLPYFSKVN